MALDVSLSESHIPGIHNHCDRWCERCEMRTRCAKASHRDAPDITEFLKEALATVQRIAEREGIDLDANDSDLSSLSFQYAIQAMRYVDDMERFRVLPAPVSEELYVDVGEALEIVSRYAAQVHTKIVRALDRRTLDHEGPEEDQIGSAKVALLMIDRSLAAWESFAPVLEGDRSVPPRLAELLTSLRARVEIAFPMARAFERIGFERRLPASCDRLPSRIEHPS